MQWLSDSVASMWGGGGSSDTAPQNAAASAPAPDESQQPLQAAGMLTKGQLLRFFDEGTRQLNDPDVKRRLKKAHEAKQDVEELISDLQQDIFQQQGIAGDWGLLCLGRINTEHRGDGDFMAAFYQFVMREEAALDEAVMPADAFAQKQAMMHRLQEQQDTFKARMAGMPPEQRQYVMQQQQLVIAQMQQQQAVMGEKMEQMSQEERKDFVNQQMDALQHELEKAARGIPDAADTVMSPQEQSGFLKSVSKSGKDV